MEASGASQSTLGHVGLGQALILKIYSDKCSVKSKNLLKISTCVKSSIQLAEEMLAISLTMGPFQCSQQWCDFTSQRNEGYSLHSDSLISSMCYSNPLSQSNFTDDSTGQIVNRLSSSVLKELDEVIYQSTLRKNNKFASIIDDSQQGLSYKETPQFLVTAQIFG